MPQQMGQQCSYCVKLSVPVNPLERIVASLLNVINAKQDEGRFRTQMTYFTNTDESVLKLDGIKKIIRLAQNNQDHQA